MDKKSRNEDFETRLEVERVRTEDSLLLFQQNKDKIDEDVYFYGVDYMIQQLLLHVSTEEMEKIDKRVKEIGNEEGLDEEEVWEDSDLSEVRKLRVQAEKERNRIKARSLRDHGESEMAELLEKDPRKFNRRSHEGWKKHRGKEAREVLGEEGLAFFEALNLGDDSLH